MLNACSEHLKHPRNVMVVWNMQEIQVQDLEKKIEW